MSIASKQVMEEQGIKDVVLYATPFLKFLASVTAAGFLLEQAVVAVSKLEVLIIEKAVEDLGLKELTEENSEARFFKNEMIAAHFLWRPLFL